MADTTNDMNDDNVQHGIDDDPHDDGKKGLELGALGGGTVGAIAGMAAGPIGAIVGAIIGGTAGSIASGAAVDAIDAIDNDNTVTGIGSGSTSDVSQSGVTGSGVTADRLHTPGNDVSGVQTGSRVVDDYATTGGAAATGNRTNLTNDDTTTVELAAEELHVDKTRQQAGEVEIHKEVVQEQVEIPVTLEHEEIVVTRHAVDRDLAPGEMATDLGDEVVRIPVSEEVANVTKSARVVEEVEVGKRVVTENQTVTGTVRHEEIDIDDSTRNRM